MDNTIAITGLTLLGAAFAYHLLQKIRSTKDAFFKAAIEFREPFVEFKMIFEKNTTGIQGNANIRETFILYVSKQKRAVGIFEPHLPAWAIKRIRKAWTCYEEYMNTENPYKWFDFDNIFKTSDEVTEKRKILIDKINHILFFADYHNVYSVFKILKRITSH